MSERARPGIIAIAAVSGLLGTSACAVSVKYQRPEMPVPAAFRESYRPLDGRAAQRQHAARPVVGRL